MELVAVEHADERGSLSLDDAPRSWTVDDAGRRLPSLGTGTIAPSPPKVAPPKPIDPMKAWREGARLHWTALPALPEPRRDILFQEERKSRIVVPALVVICLVGVHASVFLGRMSLLWIWLFLVAAWVEAAVALVCLRGVLRADPGVIQRSVERCSPVPEGPVRELLLEGAASSGPLENVEDQEHGSYCVRCFLWRRANEHAHHCSICQRCVPFFDHHCNVLGRCIAGDRGGGNMNWFRILDAMGWSGLATLLLAALAAVPRGEGQGSELLGVERLLLSFSRTSNAKRFFG